MSADLLLLNSKHELQIAPFLPNSLTWKKIQDIGDGQHIPKPKIQPCDLYDRN